MIINPLLLFSLLIAAQGAHPHRAARTANRPEKPLYDSTTVDLRNSPGISHKTVMQAARTFSRIGGHQPLDRADSAFLRIWSPAIIGAPDNPHPPQRPPQPSRVITP